MDEERLFDDVLSDVAGSPINRRGFLKITAGGIFLYFTAGDHLLLAQQDTGRRILQNLPSDFNAYLKIGTDGRVTLFTGKIEMGQGVFTSLGQMLADELDVALDAVDMVMGDTDLCPWDMGTFGSLSTRAFGPALRTAGAQARQVLLELGSKRLNVPVANLSTDKGVVFQTTDSKKRVTYAELAGGKKIDRRPEGRAEVKKPTEFKIMNTSTLRRDAREKVTGEARYAGDIRVPGMLYARLLRPPAHDATLAEVDLSEARKMKDVVVVRDGDLIAVLHKSPDVAAEALSKIKTKFNRPTPSVDDKTIFHHLVKSGTEKRVVGEGGDLARGEQGAATVIEETFLNDYVAHAPIEPHTAVASMEGEKVTVWASTQTPFSARDQVAHLLGVPPKNVRVITPFVGGGFGGKSRNLQILEAARLARLTGKPVQVAWTRAEEFFFDSFRPAAVVRIRSGLTAAGEMCLWDYHVYHAGERGAQHFYTIPNHRTTSYSEGRNGPGAHPFATGPWRAPGNNTNTFARESQIEMMAAKAGVDPLEFRLRHLANAKMRNVLQTAADEFGWKPAKGPSGRGFGIACGVDAGTTVATIAEVSVEKTTGRVKVKRVVAVQDMGMVVNPEGATLQMEGCITMGLGYALSEGLHFKGGEILDLNYDTYDIPRFSWVPDIKTKIIDSKDPDPQGGGEPAIITMGAVIANAIYDAIGARVVRLPMTPDRILESSGKG